MRALDLPDGELWYEPAAFPDAFEALERELPWRRDEIVMFGQRRQLPRLTAWVGDPGAAYTYSGLRNEPQPWTPALAAVRDAVSERLGVRFDGVLANLYRDGDDRMGWHADDEAELGPTPIVASVSFGATRDMRLKRKQGPPCTRTVALEGGSLLVMAGATQRRWLHEVPRRAGVGPRINLTFRQLALPALTVPEVALQLERMGVRRGGILQVHTSFRAVGPIVGGPEGLIAALRAALGPEGTLVMPTMTDGQGFEPASTPTVGMGIVAETFWRMAGVRRSGHPGGSFAAIGPAAERICAPQPLEPPHGADSPPGRVVALGGQVLLLGVGHGEDTAVHVAEDVASVPYALAHPCVVDGREVLIREPDHCCANFRKLDAWLGDSQRLGFVGYAPARLADARTIVDEAAARLRVDPLVFLCASGCGECDEARASVGSVSRGR